ncbi:hypothetical protein, partial [Geobacillus sp. ZGt-1]|uniref:hypothetical protein n=1 Tax=Geobacillus sp. ZGt-1 TaxID=1631556 RepID=UPI001F46ED6C
KKNKKNNKNYSQKSDHFLQMMTLDFIFDDLIFMERRSFRECIKTSGSPRASEFFFSSLYQNDRRPLR